MKDEGSAPRNIGLQILKTKPYERESIREPIAYVKYKIGLALHGALGWFKRQRAKNISKLRKVK